MWKLLLITLIRFSDVAQLFYRNNHKKAIFSPQNVFFQKNVNYTRTRWFYSSTDHGSEELQDTNNLQNLNPKQLLLL